MKVAEVGKERMPLSREMGSFCKPRSMKLHAIYSE
jgi:hypothetical protein